MPYQWFEDGSFEKAKRFLNHIEQSKKKIRLSKQYKDMDYWKTLPRTKTPHLGIEIECFFPSCEDLHGAGEALQPYKRFVEFATDGSLNGDGVARELRICLPVDKLQVLKEILTIINRYNAFVNKTCGLHVHLDMRHYSPQQVEKIGDNLMNVQFAWKEILSPSRRNNEFCRFEHSHFRSQGRYYAVNMTSYYKHRTIEVRCHQGTTNFKKIWNWCKLLLLLTKAPSLSPVRTLTSLYEQVALPQDLIDYLESRKREFAEAA